MAAKIKKDDMVQIIAGEHKGAVGRVLRINREKNQVVVEGQNRKLKHVRPSQRNPQGGRIEVEQPVHISNVLPVNPKTNKATRVRFMVDEKGAKKRVALDGTELGIVRRAKK